MIDTASARLWAGAVIHPSVLPSLHDIAAASGRPDLVDAAIIETGQNSRVLATGTTIVRVPRHAEAQHGLVREADILGVLAGRLPVPVPASALQPVGACIVAVHQRLPGEPLLSLAGFSPAEVGRLAADLAGFLRVLHAIPREALPPRMQLSDSHAEWIGLRERVAAKVFPLLSDDIAAAIGRRFERFLASGHPPLVIIHGDFGTGNILVANRRVSGIIDFAGCGIGDPAYDFASLAAGLGDDFLRLMQPHYSGIAAMADRIAFYRGTFPLLDVLAGLEHDDDQALNAGLAALARRQA